MHSFSMYKNKIVLFCNTVPQTHYKCFDDDSMHEKISYIHADKQIPILPLMIPLC